MIASAARGWLDRVQAHHEGSAVAGSSHRVADALRVEIGHGAIPPGSQLGEEALASVLGVSRNTVREAFRLLSQERLLIHFPDRGMFVRELSDDDIRDLYASRRVVELHAVRRALSDDARELDLEAARVELAAGEEASARDDARRLGTADVGFHRAIVGLAGSPRLTEAAARWLLEARLAFPRVADPLAWHRRYLVRHRAILDALTARDRRRATSLLGDYLDDAERDLLGS